MTTFFNSVPSVRLSRATATIWGLLLAAVMAVLLSGPMPSADATTTGTGSGSVRVLANTSGQSPLLTVTRLAGNDNKFTFTHRCPAREPACLRRVTPQFVSVEWSLQKASSASGPLRWTTVESHWEASGPLHGGPGP